SGLNRMGPGGRQRRFAPSLYFLDRVTAMQTAEMSMFIIEDDARFRETFIDVMSLKGIEARGAGTGAEGLRALQGLQPSVIVLDVQLPDVHGFDLCKRIKRIASFKDTPVIFLSASSQY